MAVQYNAGPVVTDGLVVLIDPASPRSYSGTGVTMTNLTGNGLNGTLTNGPTYTYADGGSYITTDGSNDRIQFPDSSTLRFTGTLPFTFDVWIYPLAIGSYFRTINRESYVNVNQRDGYTMWFNLSGGIYYTGFERYGTGTINGGSQAIDNPLNKWNNFTYTYNGSTMLIYQSGLQIRSFSSVTASITNTTEVLSFGGAISYGSYSNNRFGQVKVYDRALSATEVYNNYTALRGRYPS